MLSLEFIPGWAISLIIALIVGLLIGLEQDHPPPAGSRHFSGIGTLPLISMGGFITLHWWPGQPVFLIGLAVLGILMTAVFVRNSMISGTTGITQEISILLCWLLGGIIASGEWIAPLVIAVVTTLVLGRRAGISRGDVSKTTSDTLILGKFVLLAMVAYLVLPNQGFTQLNINPQQIWSMMLLVTGIACVGYFGMRAAGQRRHLMLTALFSGLISSTALTLALSRLSHTRPDLSSSIATSIIAASTVMFVRLLLEVAIVQPALLPITLVLFLPTMLTGTWLAWRNYSNMARAIPPASSTSTVDVPFSNPLDLVTALQFGALYGLLFALVQLTFSHFGAMGVYALSLAAGIVSVDAVTLSMAQLHIVQGFTSVTGGRIQEATTGGLPAAVVVLGITLAAVGNLLVKFGMVWGLASRAVIPPASARLGAISAVATVSVGTILLLAWRAL